MKFSHIPIMPDKCINGLNIKEDGIYVDATIGGGGHSALIAEKLSEKGRLIGIDRDLEALKASKERLKDCKCKIDLCHSNYSDIENVLKELNINKVDGILADLGVSSYQLDNADRGFSYRYDAPLDMRMDQTEKLTAKEVVNTYEFKRLADIIRMYGEDNYAGKIAKAIVREREKKEIETTFELAKIVTGALPASSRNKGAHMEKRTFQAIRIEVNGELELLKGAIESFFRCLNIGGRLAVITFHSLEDRIVKQKYLDYAKGCTCPKDFPICVCGNRPKCKIITRKPLIADENEIENNKRSKSAKLRILEKVEEI